MKYLKRLADEHLSAALRRSGAMIIEGPKWCGKTATAQQVAASTVAFTSRFCGIAPCKPPAHTAFLPLPDLPAPPPRSLPSRG